MHHFSLISYKLCKILAKKRMSCYISFNSQLLYIIPIINAVTNLKESKFIYFALQYTLQALLKVCYRSVIYQVL